MLPAVVSYLPNVPLSVLDLAPIPEGATAGDALRATIDLARRAEQLGYHRFWVAEHHNMPGIASSAPAVLIGHLAGATSSIRVGSGGVMLPNHVSLVVAEQFGMLEALHPGRIDLGIGRAADRLHSLELVANMASQARAEAPESLATNTADLRTGVHTGPASPGLQPGRGAGVSAKYHRAGAKRSGGLRGSSPPPGLNRGAGMPPYDVIVIGLGGMGSAAAYRLAQRGQRVLGLERHTPVHDQGSSHGGSRITRQAYFEDPAYVPLLLRAAELWPEVEGASGRTIVHWTGGVMVGRADSRTVAGSLRSAREWGLPHELLDAAGICRRFPTMTPAPDEVALYERAAGLVIPEESVAAHLALAERSGAEQVVVACGFSGHGFKFVPVVGEIIADLVTDGGTAHPIGPFDPRRLAPSAP